MKKSQPSLSCPQLLFRCGFTLFVLLTVIMFILINDHDDFEATEEKLLRGHSVSEGTEGSDSFVIGPSGINAPRLEVNASHIHITMVTCGEENRLNQTLITLKSIILLAVNTVHFHLFADEKLHQLFIERLSALPSVARDKFLYSLYPVTYPGRSAEDWRSLFKPCASFRLFLPEVLPNVEAVIYLDTDTLALAPVDHIHAIFRQFNDSQSLALAPASLDPSSAWYNRYARHPFYGQLGLNSGVMLMNLTRLRQTTWSRDVIAIFTEYKYNLVFGDQDIINIWGHYHPERMYELPCEYNYIPSFCIFGHLCTSADEHGVQIVHGTMGSFYKRDQPVFMRLHQVFQEYDYKEDLKLGVYERLVTAMSRSPRYGCGLVSSLFYKGYQTFVEQEGVPIDTQI